MKAWDLVTVFFAALFMKLSENIICNALDCIIFCNKSEDKPHLGIKNEQVLLFCSLFALSLHQIVVIMTIKEFFSFRQNKYFWINVMAMIVVVALLLFGTLKGIDIYTRHGEAVVVPDVKGMTVAEAGTVFGNRGLACVVSDSTYVKDKPAGCILDYNPAAGQKVKEGRIIYLTINAINIPLQAVPDVADNSSLRQAEARILASGFKLNDIEYMAGEKDWVYGVKYQGRMLAIDEKVPMGATLTLMVGNGDREVLESDSLSANNGTETQEPVGSEGSAADESWF